MLERAISTPTIDESEELVKSEGTFSEIAHNERFRGETLLLTRGGLLLGISGWGLFLIFEGLSVD